MSQFDRTKHRFAPPRYFEDLTLGETFYIPSRTMTSGLFAAFQSASGDNHPIHYDREYLKDRGHRGLLAHGLMVFIQSAAGAGTFPHQMGDSLMGMLGGSFEIKHPLYEGDTVYPLLTVGELKSQNTTGIVTVGATIHNQDNVLVLEGSHRYLLRKRPT